MSAPPSLTFICIFSLLLEGARLDRLLCGAARRKLAALDLAGNNLAAGLLVLVVLVGGGGGGCARDVEAVTYFADEALEPDLASRLAGR